ncbi:hypothetical protein LRH25_06415 [Ideonella azotifigens]|uniref:DUF3955 domain-containing protein n=1 Tax=Ideonella azotifigens TaxID=513160 RepID=A0ABP3UVY1_9BURK|nr:hypothetical protein [Ideonella azotifigens]MCD2339972.1 hypothetical protein [Ideonella azotifigens]
MKTRAQQNASVEHVGLVLIRGLLVLALLAFALMGTCGGVFSLLDLRSAHPGESEFIGMLPYASLGIGVLGVGACWSVLRWLRRRREASRLAQ